MRIFSALLALASLTAALTVKRLTEVKGVLSHPDHWEITGLAIAGGSYSFSATVKPDNVPSPVSCKGSVSASNYVKCAYINADDTIWAYIAGGKTLKLQYRFLAHAVDTAYYFFGETSDLTKASFSVAETPNSLKAITPIPAGS